VPPPQKGDSFTLGFPIIKWPLPCVFQLSGCKYTGKSVQWSLFASYKGRIQEGWNVWALSFSPVSKLTYKAILGGMHGSRLCIHCGFHMPRALTTIPQLCRQLDQQPSFADIVRAVLAAGERLSLPVCVRVCFTSACVFWPTPCPSAGCVY